MHKRYLFLFCLSVYLLSSGGHLYSADTEIKALITEGMVERGSVALPEVRMIYMVPGRDGLSYAPFPVGTSITMIPFYMVGDGLSHLLPNLPRELILEFFLSLINQLATALTCMVLFSLCRQMGYSVRTALVTALIYGFCTIAWPYAKTCWSEPQATLCILAAFYCVVRFGSVQKPAWLVWAGLLTGYGITTKHEMGLYMFLLTGLIVCYMYRNGFSWRNLLVSMAAYGIPLACFGFLNLYYNYLRFESWFHFGHYASLQTHFERSDTIPFLDSIEGIVVGVYQRLFSSGKSILLYSPPVILVYWAFKSFWLNHRAEAVFCLAVPVVFFISAGSSWQMSGIAWGERYFMSITPFMVLPLSALAANLLDHRKAFLKKSLIGLSAAGFCVQIIAVSVNFQATVDKLVSKGGKFDVQLMSYDPEYSPLLLNFKAFLSRIPDTWRLATQGLASMEKTQSASTASLTMMDFKQKSLRDAIRYHTFDFWFLYMYFMNFSMFLIIIAGSFLSALIVLSGRRLYSYLSFDGLLARDASI